MLIENTSIVKGIKLYLEVLIFNADIIPIIADS